LNQRRRQLTSGDSFTQADVDNGRLAYRMYPTINFSLPPAVVENDVADANDRIELHVTTSCASSNHFLLIHYRSTSGNVRLINLGLFNVPEGGSAFIGPELLNVEAVYEQKQRRYIFTVTEPARHGVLQIARTGSRNGGVVSKSNTTRFEMDDIVAGRVRYVHDDSETRNDSFRFSVTESTSGDVTTRPVMVSKAEVVFSGRRFLIGIALQNDNVPSRVNDAALEVVFGVGRRLSSEELKYVDADVDTQTLDFTWQARSDKVG